jgi:hypothetical protein
MYVFQGGVADVLYTMCNVSKARSLGFWYLGVSYESTQMITC